MVKRTYCLFNRLNDGFIYLCVYLFIYLFCLNSTQLLCLLKTINTPNGWEDHTLRTSSKFCRSMSFALAVDTSFSWKMTFSALQIMVIWPWAGRQCLISLEGESDLFCTVLKEMGGKAKQTTDVELPCEVWAYDSGDYDEYSLLVWRHTAL
jgi:hypothetical protein